MLFFTFNELLQIGLPLEKIEAEVVTKLPKFGKHGEYTYTQHYIKETDGIWLPRFYVWEHDSSLRDNFMSDIDTAPKMFNFETLQFTGQLRDTKEYPQQIAYAACLEKLDETGGAMLVLLPGMSHCNIEI